MTSLEPTWTTRAEEVLPRQPLPWIDAVKGVAILWIVANHVSEALFGSPLFQNPNASWPTLAERFAQVQPLGQPLADLLRYVGWMGDQGVGLFLVCTGIVLTYGLVKRDGELLPLETSRWWPKRFSRMMPMYWVLFILMLVPSWLLGYGAFLSDREFWISLTGLRPPAALYYGVPAFWYISLLVQLYIVFPLMWWLAHRLGLIRAATGLLAITIILRLVGLLVLDTELDFWSRGGIVVSRLPEVLVGMLLGYAFARDPSGTSERLRRPRWIVGGLLSLLVGSALGFTLAGMAFNPVLASFGGFLLLHALFTGRRGSRLASARGPISWSGRHALSLFLVNQIPCQVLLYPVEQFTFKVLVRVIVVLALIPMAALTLEWITERTVRLWRRQSAHSRPRAFTTLMIALAIPFSLMLALEAATRARAPQEVNGWGERPSLVSSERFGWTRAPGADVRLRWLGYDYRAVAGASGFPGPDPTPDPGETRVLVLGDAFTSPEGVEPEQGWVSLLENALETDMQAHVGVFNAATTGYGPDQNARVAEALIPQLKPDVVVLEMFVNDFDDVRLSDDDFRRSIGFGEPPGDSVQAWLRFSNSSRWARTVIQEARARATASASPAGWSLAQLSALKRGGIRPDDQSSVTRDLERIVTAAHAAGARVDVVMAPSSVQVCAAADLRYSVGSLDLDDDSVWDADGPQRAARRAAAVAGADSFTDLREALVNAPNCPYHPTNMHWLPEGHSLVANFLAPPLAERLKAATP